MMSLGKVPEIDDNETLARAVVSGGEAKESRKGDVPASVFSHLGHFKISVDRISRMTFSEAVEHGKAVAAERGSNRTFYGWALLGVPDVLESGCLSKSAPEGVNFWHAHILMPKAAAHNGDLHYEHAGALARRSSWRERSDA